MFRIYAIVIVVGLVGGAVWGAYGYYNDTQQRIATLTENNAQLEVAAETANASVNKLQGDIEKMASLNKTLQQDLQKAEAYGDELREKLNNLNHFHPASSLKDSKATSA